MLCHVPTLLEGTFLWASRSTVLVFGIPTRNIQLECTKLPLAFPAGRRVAATGQASLLLCQLPILPTPDAFRGRKNMVDYHQQTPFFTV